MKLKNFNLSRQIGLYLGVVSIIVLILVSSSYYFINSISTNMVDLYEHPFTVSIAVREIQINTHLIHKVMKQLPLEDNQENIEKLINSVGPYETEIARQLEVIYARFLGSQDEIDEVVDELNQWKNIRTETVRLLRAGQIDEVASRVKDDGVGGMTANGIINHLEDISNFASAKADELYQTALQRRDQLYFQLLILSISILLLLISIGYFLRKSILPPLQKLSVAANAVQQGNYDTRILIESQNELGELSHAFNNMTETIQREIEYKENIKLVSSGMFEHDTLRHFCQKLLKDLLSYTDSNIGAIYFLNKSNHQFEQYESIGLKQNSLTSFSAERKEGEFGAVLSSRKIEHLTDIPSDINVVFSTVSGEFKVKEIITIPVVDIKGDEIISVISLASIKNYSSHSVRLINGLMNEIVARINALMTSQQLYDYSQRLKGANTELEQQAKELSLQADELVEQNTELEMQKVQLDEANRLKTNFISTMSHELRTPLNSVIALSGVLSRRLSNKISNEESSYLEIIERNGKNLLTLINDILDISRIEAGREEIDVTEFSVDYAISEVVSMIHPQAVQRNINLVHELSDNGTLINTDENKFRHIIQNLISNAVKFTEKGYVEVVANLSDSHINITVTDTGIGISSEHLPYIFDEFRQADGSTSRRFGGSGLGLAISKKYANLLGGTITVQSEIDKGSRFILSLPLKYASENQVRENINTQDYKIKKNYPIKDSDFDLTGKSVLLVEDNESSIIQIKDVIGEIGCQVQVAHDSVEAFASIDQSIPDAMILDLMMPDVDGFKVLEILRNAEQTAHVPVLILTAKHITKEELKYLKRNNVHQLIQKGDIKRFDLQQAVVNMLHHNKDKEKQPTIKYQDIHDKPVVLVVEDNPDNMTTVKALLEDNHLVLEAVNAREGIELAKQHLPNLILMDIALPDINGIDAFKEIRNATTSQHIPVIALTASVMTHERETILSHGFDAFIAKPIIEKEFFDSIKKVLYGK